MVEVARIARQRLRRWPSFLDMKNLRVGITALAVLGLLVLTVSCGTVTPGGSDSTVVPVYYATDRKPLMPLETWQQKSRAGDGGRNVAVCEGIDTVDASDVDTDTLGHNYLATSRAVIADAADIICRSLPPEQRNLTRMSSNGLAYWKLKKPDLPSRERFSRRDGNSLVVRQVFESSGWLGCAASAGRLQVAFRILF